MDLSSASRTFISHFGEMGSRWGINRTVGQIYALLYLSEAALHADEIAETLGISRSNVSMGIKELESWRLVRLKHIQGDRKEYYTVPDDIWVIFRTLVEERKKREIDPTLTMLRDVMLAEPERAENAHARKKMRDMLDLIEMTTGWYMDMQKLETERLVNLLKLGSKVYRLYEMKDKLTLVAGGKRKEREA